MSIWPGFSNPRGPLTSSIKYGKPAIRPGEDGHQAPGWDTGHLPFFTGWLAVLVEDLPGHGAALFPTHSFCPDQDDFPSRIFCYYWVLASLAFSWGRYGD